MPTVQPAVSCEAEVKANGQLEVTVPFPAGTRVMVFVIEQSADECADLLEASQSSLNFWDHPFDDEDWNDA